MFLSHYFILANLNTDNYITVLMGRYYCEYCHSYLTHDTLSVRKSHLVGKNHLRITADFYRNKARQRSKLFNRISRKHGKRKEKINLPLSCPKRSEKKRASKLSRIHSKELDQPIHVLSNLYRGSPGYSKIFIDVNRLDIGDLVRVSKLPQRANTNALAASAGASRARNETFTQSLQNAQSTPLEPPRVLSNWSNLPKTVFHDPSLPRATVNESRNRIR